MKNQVNNIETYYNDMQEVWEKDYPSVENIKDIEQFYKDYNITENIRGILDQMIDRIDIAQDRGRLLDFGCDNGIMLNFFKKYPFELYGTDINHKSIEEGKKLFPEFKLVTSNALTIPFPDNYFDLIFASAVLKHIRYEDRAIIYKEFKRTAKYLLVLETNSTEKKTEKMGNFTFYLSDFKNELDRNFTKIKHLYLGEDILGLYKLN